MSKPDGRQTRRVLDDRRRDRRPEPALSASRRRLAAWLDEATPTQVQRWRAYDATPRPPLFRRYAEAEQVDWTLEAPREGQRRR